MLTLLAISGCAPADPLEQVVIAQSPLQLEMWKTRMAGLPPLRREFDGALQDIRYGIMLDRQASGREAVDQALRSKIAGHTVREVLYLGYAARLFRLECEQTSYQKSIAQLARVRTRAGDAASAEYVDRKRQEHLARLLACGEEIRGTTERITRLGKNLPESRLVPADELNEMPVRLPADRE